MLLLFRLWESPHPSKMTPEADLIHPTPPLVNPPQPLFLQSLGRAPSSFATSLGLRRMEAASDTLGRGYELSRTSSGLGSTSMGSSSSLLGLLLPLPVVEAIIAPSYLAFRMNAAIPQQKARSIVAMPSLKACPLSASRILEPL